MAPPTVDVEMIRAVAQGYFGRLGPDDYVPPDQPPPVDLEELEKAIHKREDVA